MDHQPVALRRPAPPVLTRPEDVDVDDLANALHDAAPACRAAPDPDLWFPDSASDTRTRRSHAEAFEICDACPVRLICLEFALRTPFGEHGIWGSTTPKQQARIRRQRDIAAHTPDTAGEAA